MSSDSITRLLDEIGGNPLAAEITFALDYHLRLTGYPQLAFELLMAMNLINCLGLIF